MHLINTETLRLEEFFGHQIPEYAALSHRWGKDEVSFKDFTKGRQNNGPGWSKIVECCSYAKERGMKWCWIDTCCIDKRSSAELSEAIVSIMAIIAVAK
jgi:hypothetical protein